MNTGSRIFCNHLSCLCILCLGVSASCLAEAKGSVPIFQIHGFAAQSFIDTSHNNFFGASENGSWDFRELGLNALWRPTDDVQLALQAVARNAGATDDGDLRIDYGFLQYTLYRSVRHTTEVRLGRVVNPYGLYNDTRDVAATRPSILLPQSIYFDVNRNLALSSDGLQLSHEYGGQSGYYIFQFGVFDPRTEDPDFEPAIFLRTVPGKLVGATSWMGRLLYEHDFGRIRLGLTAADVNVDYEPGHSDPINSGEFRFRPYMVSAQYNAENWSLTAEYARRTTQTEKFGEPFDTEFTGSSYFLQATYRFSEVWHGWLRYDELIWNGNDRRGRAFESATGLAGHSRFARDWTFGAGWDATRSVMLRAEWHRVNGTGWLSLLENPRSGGLKQHWDLFAISASIRF